MNKYITLSLITLASFGLAASVACAQTVTVTSQFQFTHDLSVGVNSADVKQLQILLNKDTDTQVSASGDGSTGKEVTNFGMHTMKAVQAFQKKHKLNPSGFVGPLTRAELNKLVASLNPSLPSITNLSSVIGSDGAVTLTAKYDGGGEKPTIWFAYGAGPSAMTILSKEITGDKVVGNTQVSINGLGGGDCFAQAYVKNSVGTSKSETVHCK